MGMDSESRRRQKDSTPREMKAFIRRVSLVCRRWNRITRWKANPHFWQTHLVLTLSLVDDRGHENASTHRFHAVTLFRRACDTVQDSDISLRWYNDGELLQRTEFITWTRIFMHCIAGLADYSHQISILDLHYLDEYAYSFAKNFICRLRDPRRLSGITITTFTTNIDPPLVSSDYGGEPTYLFDMDYQSHIVSLGVFFQALSHLHIDTSKS